MHHEILLGLTLIIVLGISSQWLAWRLSIPSILLLLGTGLLLGPIFHVLEPDAIFQDMLYPFVSIAVGVILFEGGLTLKLSDIRHLQTIFFRLTTIGVICSLTLTAIAAHWLLKFPWGLAILFGSILVVTGPTVIGPILRHLRMSGQVAALLKWEGILIDPIGATLAVMVYTVLRINPEQIAANAFGILALTAGLGSLLGFIAGYLIAQAFSRYWVPDSLHNAVTLMTVILTFTVSNLLVEESGLFATTIMGITLANQKRIAVRHLVEFKENLAIILISTLFVTLAARLSIDDLRSIDLGTTIFLLILIFVVRPVSVFISTFKTTLSWPERIFLASMAPRGIVAVAVSSIFALSMVEIGYKEADQLVPKTFLVVFATVLLYGLWASPLARTLGLVAKNPQGMLIVGAHSFAQAVAKTLMEAKIDVILVDTNYPNIREARLKGIPTYFGSILSEQTQDELDLSSIGRLLALTPSDELNALACMTYQGAFTRKEVYQLPFSLEKKRFESIAEDHRGRFLFDKSLAQDARMKLFNNQPIIKKSQITKEYTIEQFRGQYNDTAIILFIINKKGTVEVVTQDATLNPEEGSTIIFWVRGDSTIATLEVKN